MKQPAPHVSVLICTYNADQFITETVESVLKQTYSDFELLILDNASTDGTVVLLNKLEQVDKRIRVFQSKKNLGPYGGLNYLLDRAKGTYIAINDHDDIWHPDKLRRQIDFLEEHPTHAGCGTAIINWYQKYDKYLLRTQPREHVVAWHTSLVFRNTGKRYDISVPIGTDFHFMKAILCENKESIYNMPEPMVLRRIWRDQRNLTSNWIRKDKLASILSVRLPLLDKLSLLNRLLVPGMVMDYLLLHVLLRTQVFSAEELPQQHKLRWIADWTSRIRQ